MACPCEERRPGVARHASNFLSLARQESHQRKGDPTVCDPFAALRGNLGCSVTGCTAELAARLWRSARTTAVSQFTRHARSDAHATPRPARPRRIQKGTRRTSIRAIAALGPDSAARGACAREMAPSEAKARVGIRLLDVRLSNPLLAAPAAGRLWGGMGVEAPMPRALTRRSCPNGAAKQRSEFCGAPRNRPDAGLPRSKAQGSQTGGRLSFGYFSLAKQRTSTSAAGPRPGFRTETKHTFQPSAPWLRSAQLKQ